MNTYNTTESRMARIMDELQMCGVPDEEVTLGINLLGYSEETLNRIMYAKFGCRCLGQLLENEDDDVRVCDLNSCSRCPWAAASVK